MPSPFPGMDPYLEGDLGGFDLIVDYSKPPAVSLSAYESAWVAERLRAKSQ